MHSFNNDGVCWVLGMSVYLESGKHPILTLPSAAVAAVRTSLQQLRNWRGTKESLN